MKKADIATVAQRLEKLGQRIALEGGNPYRARAYSRAAQNLALSPAPLDKLIAQGGLTQIPGIGDALAAVITEIYETGDYSGLKARKESVPDSVLNMLRIPGLRPERIRKLHTELGISSVEELEKAARTDRLKSAKGFGPAFQAKVLQGIALSRQAKGRHIHRAAAALEQAAAQL